MKTNLKPSQRAALWLLCLLCLLPRLLSAQGLVVDQPSITFGGGIVTSGSHEISSTLGQPIVGTASGGDREFYSGRWEILRAYAFTDVALSSGSIAENQPASMVVGALSAPDPEDGSAPTFSLVSGAGDTDNASFAISGANLVTAAVFNYESKSSYSIRLRATDSFGEYYEKAVTVTVLNVNEAPSNISLSGTGNVNENLAVGSTVGTLSAADQDAGETAAFTLVTGTGDTDNGYFDISGTTLKTKQSINYETKSSLSCRVRVTDGGGLFYEKTFTITINNVNEAPTDISLSAASVLENQPSGTTVGTLTATDPDAGDTVTFSLVSGYGDNASFTIAGGALKTAAAFNYESKSSYSIKVRATDNASLTFDKTFTIAVVNVNEAPTLNALTSVTLLEDAAAQTVSLGGISTGGDSGQTLTITASSSNPALIPNPAVTYSSGSTTGTLAYTPAASLQGTATITVTATDNGGTANGGVNSVSQTFTVTVIQVNDAPTLDALTSVTVDESAGAQTVSLSGIGTGAPNETQTLTFTATSSNTGLIPNPTITYAPPSATGTLTYTPAVLGANGSALITVTLTDNGSTANGGVTTTTRSFTVNVTGVNDAPTIAAISDPAAILEDAGLQTISLGGITAGGGESQSLTVTATSSNTGRVPHPTVTYTSSDTTGTLTYTPVANANGTPTITVTVTDSGNTANGGVKTTITTFKVNITAVNDAPTLDALTSVTINEDAGVQNVSLAGIGSGAANESQSLTVTATSSHTGKIPHPTVTYTSPVASGTLAFTPAANVSGTVTITVRVTDNGGTASGGVNTFTRTFTVSITPVADAPTDIFLSAASVNENLASGSTVGTLTDADADAGDTATFALVSGNGSTDNASFTIDGNALKTAAVFNYEAKSSYAIRLRVTDSTSLTFEKEFNISVNDVNEAPTDIAMASAGVNESAAVGSLAGTLGATDVDADDTATFALVSGTGDTGNANFEVSGTNLLTTAVLDYDTATSHSIRVRVTDGGGLTFDKVLAVAVTNVNAAPTDISLSANSVDERLASGTTVGTLTASDTDAGDTATFTLVSGTGSTDNGSFTITGTSLKTAAVFNYDTKSSYSIRVRVTDSGAGTFEEVFTITVNNVNAAPTDISLSGTSVSENQPAGTFVGSFSASDADAGDTATFTLVSGTGDTDNANFTMAGGALETAAELDFETQTSHSIRVRVTDAGGLFYEEQFTINVGNLADVHNLAGTALWTNRYDNATNDQATAVAVDSSGNVFVAGYSQTGAANTKDFATIAYSTDGLALWTNRHNGPGNNVDQPTAIAVGGNGNVYVAGFSRSGSGAASEDFATVAYSGSGVLLWSNRHNGTGNNSDQPAAIAVNSSGNVFVTGYAHNGTDNDFATVAYSSAGALLWSNVFNGAANGADQATGIAVDASGNVYVTGFSSNGANNDYATVAYSSAGVALWTNVFNGTGNAADQASGIAVDASGNVYVSGFSSNGANNDYATVAYSSAGVALWTNRFNPNGNSDVAYGIAAGGGNVYVTGESAGGGTGGDYYTVAYSSAGGLLWSNRYNGPGNSTDSARAIKTDGAGNVYVTGFSRSSTTAASEDYATVAYSSAGMPLWTNRFNGTGNLTDQALALAVDTNANVYVTGYTGSGTNDDFATIKYAGNLAPTDIVLSASSVAENSASGTVVGTFSLTDPDTGETATYSLVSGTGGTDNSSFTISGNALKTAAVFDYDVKSSYSIRVRATDSGRLTFDKVFTITVGNVNFSPTDISLSAGSVVEHAASGTSVGVLSATDADAGDTHTFTLVSGAGDTDNASFSIAGSALQTAAVFDYEVKNSYSVRVRVTDAGGLTFEEVFAIAVTDANEAPTDILATGFTADWVSMGVSVPGLLGSGSSQGRAVVVSGTDTYVGGTFSVVGTVSANNIAKWNGTTWSVLGAGLNGTVNALALDAGGNLYAGGSFTNVGGSGASYIAKWNGVSWTSLGTGMNGAVNALAFDASGNLYAGGSFTLAGGVSANRVAKWDGSAWSSLGSGVGSAVNALAVDASGNLYVGGNFTTAGGATANRIAKWDGAAWSALGTGMSGGTPTAVVNALAFDGSGNLYAGGEFTSAGGTSASRVAKWNGSAWAALGTGIANTVDALAVNGSDLYAGGNFSTAGGGSASRIAKWDGSAWAALGSGLGNTAFALAVDGGDLYAGGSFTTAGGNPAVGIAKWNGSAWSAFGTWAGVNGLIQAAVYVGTNLYVGGDFTTAGGVTVNRIAKWDGSAWSALGSGVPNNSVLCLAAIGTDLYVGGSFTSAGGVANTTRIAKWNGTAWSAMGTGGNNAVAALAVIGADLYAGGAFTSMGGVANTARIAKWNGTSWSALGTGADNTVRALAVSGTDLYVGGSIDFAGGISAKSVAKWSTASSTWSALGSGLNSAVRALAIDSGGNLCVGGDFTTAGGISANRVAKWNGSAWSTLGTGMNNNVYAMVADGAGNIYAGGGFSTADGGSASRVAKWNGSAWSAVGSGMDGSANQSVLALAFAGSDLYAGGGFTTASGKVSPYLARAQIGVGENAALGTTVATLTTVDVDSGGSHTYTLVTGTGDADNGSFMIVGDALKTATALDYETKSSYTVRVRVTDGGGLTVEKAFGISVTNVNDTPTDITLSAASVAENQPAGTTVGTLATSDQDAGDTVVFTLVSGTGSTDNASFTLAGTTLQTSASFDYESKSSYSIRVRATDSGGLTYEEAFTVTVINVNDAPTDISLSTASVAENAASGATVGTLTATDADAGDTATLTFVVGVGSEDNDSFTISGGALQTATVFNYEVKSSYSVRVQVTDAGGLTFEKAFTIAINDANDAPVDIALSAVVVTENAAIGTGIGSFTATDVDAGDSHTFTLVSGAGSADNANFTIADGTLQTAAALDYETKGSHSIRVRATDGGGLFVEKQFTVTVTDANDAPSNISLSASSVAENAVSGTAVGTLTAADQDAGDTAAFTLVSGAGDSDNASFTLAGNTLQTAASFDYETKRSLSLRVRATDAGGLPFEQQLTVTVTEVYEYTAGWTNRYDGPASGFDQASAVAVDAAGNVFVAGYSHNGTDNDYVTIKYLADGSAAWTNRYDGPGNNTGEAKALVVDSDGSVYVTGFSQGASTRDYATIKYLADGTPAWTNRYDGPGGTADEAAAISVDGSGNVFVTGFAGNDYATVGYSSAGTALWTNRYNGPANGNDQARAVAVDGTGSVFVTGFSVGSGSSQDYATIKYLANGTPAWTNRYTGATGSSADFAKALAVDSAGNVFVTGYSGANNDYATVAYSGAGTPLWTNRYNGTGNGNDQAAAVAVDAGGNVMVTGKSLGAGTGFDYATIKYSGAGVALWTNRYNNGAISDDDSAQALGVDASGQVLVAGFSRMAVGQDFVTLKYSSAGVPLWTNNYNGPGNANDYAYALAVDHAGNVFVAGGSDGDGTSHDFAVVKYAARTAPASILLSAASLAENSDAGTTVGTLTAQDFDAGD
ncbi:MAG: cadherin domain-containing protein, partial [Verrucomicrobia bacterium]|nr:cadherin domain-containing protein [Verrucomicrobiota bacterium]